MVCISLLLLPLFFLLVPNNSAHPVFICLVTLHRRNFMAVLMGITVGILGVTGWHGFIYHFASQLLVSDWVVVIMG